MDKQGKFEVQSGECVVQWVQQKFFGRVQARLSSEAPPFLDVLPKCFSRWGGNGWFRVFFVFLGLLLVLMPISAFSAPDANEILRSARVNTVRNEAHLEGKLREDEGSIPLDITLKDGVVSYAFRNTPETISLDFGREGEMRIKDTSGERELTGEQLHQRVQGTNLTYEDLAMHFLYWPIAKFIGQEVIKTRPAYKIEVHPGKRGSEFGAARLWIDKETGALLRIEGYDWNGVLLKRFEVISAQKIEGQWFLKSMRIEQFDPYGHIIDRTYLDIVPPEQSQKSTGTGKAEVPE